MGPFRFVHDFRRPSRRLKKGKRFVDIHERLAGLPDGSFSKPNPNLVCNFGGLRLENVDIFYGRL
jgi:hypothetical protein